MSARIQEPSKPENWLYKDYNEYNRQFSKFVRLGKNDMPWPECTTEEKEEWEREHPAPEPEVETTDKL